MSCMVLVDLPQLPKHQEEFKEIAKKHSSFIRGVNEEKKDSAYEIWSTRKLARTEVELI